MTSNNISTEEAVQNIQDELLVPGIAHSAVSKMSREEIVADLSVTNDPLSDDNILY